MLLTLLWPFGCVSAESVLQFSKREYSCTGGTAEVSLPDRWPILVEIFGFNEEWDEGYWSVWWKYQDVPEFEPGEAVAIPCTGDDTVQDGGWVTYTRVPDSDADCSAEGCGQRRAYEVFDADCNETRGLVIGDEPRVLQLLARWAAPSGSAWSVVPYENWHSMAAVQGGSTSFTADCSEGQLGWRIVYVH